MSSTEIAYKVLDIPIEDEMKESYLDYAMSVIVSRALPDVRDGLKPVHRRILYAMDKLGLTSDKSFKKSATIVGDVIGKYHPHGDAAVYDTLVRMAQDFNMRYPLVNGHGNFGSIDGDPPAAYRYTEARMHKISTELLEDLDKETVDFRPNFDNSLQEPEVLPANFPNLLLNGSSGIAVGMATNIPPHNLTEVIDGTIATIDEPDISPERLIKIIKAPDFPTGGYIMGIKGVKEAYLTGRGSVTMRAKTSFEEIRGKRTAIIVTEIPYQVNKSRILEQIAEGARARRITGVSDLRDESDRTGMRIVIELQAHTNPQITMNQLLKHTNLQANFGIIMLALVDGVPRVITLKDYLNFYLKHRYEVVERRSKFELKKAKERAHILEGLQIALDNIDAVIKVIRNSQEVKDAKDALMKKFKLTDVQAQAILEMRLQRLAALERIKIADEHKELQKKIKYLEDLLKSPKKIYQVIKEELQKFKEKYSDKRRTMIKPEERLDFEIEELIPDEEIVVTVTNSGYIKRMPAETYRSQKRGGRGISGVSMKEEDYLDHLFVTTTHYSLLCFTSQAKVYKLMAHELPEASRQAKGTNIINLLSLAKHEKVTAVFPVKSFDSGDYLIMATKKGVVNKSKIKMYSNIRRTGFYALNLDPDDELVDVRLTSPGGEIVLITRAGKSIRFKQDEVRPTGRKTRGVRGIRIGKGDEVVGMLKLLGEKEILVVTKFGHGKRTEVDEYRLQSRGGKGIKTIKITEKNGPVVAVRGVNPDDELMLISKKGTVIRMKVKDISVLGRVTQGVRVVRLDEEDEVSSMAIIEKKEDE